MEPSIPTDLEPDLADALARKGYDSLTPVQEAVLAATREGRDLRISSQTGSGKTVAIGFALRAVLDATAPPTEGRSAQPRAVVVAPTRELAKQVEAELAWLFAPLGARVVSVTGGGGYRDELRAFRQGPAVVVGTPGRLRDHLERGSLDASQVAAVVLDEADRMLDMGFREDIEAIFGHMPEERRTHLVSATFPREVEALANQVQEDPVRVEGTPLGAANLDIEHVIHLVRPDERLAAVVNLLLASPGARTLVFARMRSDVADLATALADAGFPVGALSGEMEQAERNRTLAGFKRGAIGILVATDVAARGIDVQDVTLVIHGEPPSDPDSYTHRSGRTGRAGRKGTSAVLTTPADFRKTTRLLERARVRFRVEPVPTPAQIRERRDAALLDELTREDGEKPGERAWELARRLAESGDLTRALARLVARAEGAAIEPRHVTPIEAPAVRTWTRTAAAAAGPRGDGGAQAWVPFRVSWGQIHGADARRLLAMLCRRGGIDGRDVGAIRLARTFSIVDVSASIADAFERATREPDPRDARIRIRRWSEEPTRDRAPAAEDAERAERPARGARPDRERPARPAHHDRPTPAERPARPDRSARDDRRAPPPAERHARPERERHDRGGPPARERPARPARPEAERPARPKGHDRPARPERPARPAQDRPSRARAHAGDRPPKRRR